ncbi:putative methyltransferase-like protein C27D7.08c [Aspergillus udagawae]|uniref:Putative methyltransferase-like protein C27D7.08c n=1 Tax=Aspergillus udagawae TaxID=91492 RepID=A0A8H3P329_9EURO|nr:putative methyltransferase-like protein C27D7.08c [Aspergillus udagawae]
MRATRNIYKDDVDFTALALQSPAFAKYVKPNGQLDFSDPDAVRQLTKSLLKRDFNLDVEIPDNRLCPPVPNRLNYILWLQDLLDTTGDQYRDDYDPDRSVLGLDIGTGCCSIYPLLGCTTRPLWDFIATDIDDENVRTARENVTNNGLDGRIRVFKTEPKDDLIPLDTKLDVQRLDFTMCNPPFYASREEMIASAQAKERPPFSACTGAEVEMVTGGGEIAFVYRMIEESLHLRERVVWYTSMLGKLSSVSVIVEKLTEHGNNNYAVTEFVQGSKTKRWAVAWSWTDLRPSMKVARGIPGFPKHLLPFPSEFLFEIADQSIDDISDKIDKELSSLRIHWTWRKNLATGVGFAMENVWSRQARRKLQISAGTADMMEIDESTAALGFKVQLKQDRLDEKCVRVVVRWLKGSDSVLFESFCGMLKRKVEGR